MRAALTLAIVGSLAGCGGEPRGGGEPHGGAIDAGAVAGAGDGGAIDAARPVALRVTVSGPGAVVLDPPGVACADDCTELYPIGATVRLRGTAEGCVRLDAWGGACDGVGPCQVTVGHEDLEVSAAFGAGAALWVAPPPVGAIASRDGRIHCPPDCYAAYECGDAVTVDPPTGSYFAWTGPCAGDCPCQLDVVGDVALEPRFADGAVEQVVAVRGGHLEPTALAIDGGGAAYVAGRFSGGIELGGAWRVPAGGDDGFVVKLSPGGAQAWSRVIADDEGGTGVAAAAIGPGGDLVVGGSFFRTADLGAGPIVSDEDSDDSYLARFAAADGAPVWVAHLRSAGLFRLADLAVDGAGDVVAIGSLYGAVAIGELTLESERMTPVVFKLDGDDGDVLWARALAADRAEGRAVAVAGDGIAIGGIYQDVLELGCGALPSGPLDDAGASEGFVARLDAAGACLWARSMVGPGIDEVADVAVGEDAVIAAGHFQGATKIEGGSVASAGATDGFAVVYDGGGTHRFTRFAAGVGADHVRRAQPLPDGRLALVIDHRGAIELDDVGLCSASDAVNAALAIYDGDGALLETRDHGLAGGATARGVAVGPGDALRLLTTFAGEIDVGQGAMSAQGAQDLVVTSIDLSDGDAGRVR